MSAPEGSRSSTHPTAASAPEVAECSICLEALTSRVKHLACSHDFHDLCINQWALEDDSCPLCRAPINEKAVPAVRADRPVEEIMPIVRRRIYEIRKLSLDEDSDVARTACKVDAVASRFFGRAEAAAPASGEEHHNKWLSCQNYLEEDFSNRE
jgi:hypothetical protein